MPATPVIGTSGCFNNTLCHGQLGHPADWAATGHKTAAKAAASTSTGLDYCRNCHGTDFKGGTSGTSCFSCHSSAPHAKPWLKSAGATTYIHSTTDQTNATACGRCHGGGAKLATPTTPPANAGCFNNTLCHGTVVAHAFPNPGSLHRTSTTGCSSCHALGTGASPYPVAASIAPDCKSCHKLSTATSMALMAGCSDCHGDAATGRPNGASFPNRAGQHNRSEHVGRACTACHPFTSGNSSHGWSNRVISTSAQVNAPGWNPANKSCTNSCHEGNTYFW
ncbi:MAG: hypothetical protein PHI31_05230 [Desulfuromonadaceae bacterium]|nr:hypothetical protein [Desulfuromonadaceae bacterium]